jgi:hypothetical protein
LHGERIAPGLDTSYPDLAPESALGAAALAG